MFPTAGVVAGPQGVASRDVQWYQQRSWMCCICYAPLIYTVRVCVVKYTEAILTLPLRLSIKTKLKPVYHALKLIK